VESQLKAFEYSSFRLSNLTKALIISFSFADGSPDICGLISGGNMWQVTVQKWLALSGIAISNPQLHPIGDRFKDPLIRSFLEDSELPAAGESSLLGRRLRLDTMAPSGKQQAKKTGRPPKRDARQAPAPAVVPAPDGTSAPPPPARPSPLTAGGDALPLSNGPWPPALLPQLAANWPPPGGWPGGHGLPSWSRLPAYFPAAMTGSGNSEAGSAGGPAAAADGCWPEPAAAGSGENTVPPPPPAAAGGGVGQHTAGLEAETAGRPAGDGGEYEPPIDTSTWEPSSPDSRDFQLLYFRRILRREKAQKDPYADSTDDDEAPGLDGASGTAGEACSVAVAALDGVGTAGTTPQPCKHAGEMRNGAVADATGGRISSDSDVPGAESLVTAAGNGNFLCEPASGGCGNSFFSAIDGCSDALAAPPSSRSSGSFLSLLTDQHGIHKFQLNDAEQFLRQYNAPLLAENIRTAPNLDAVRDLCACIHWIRWPFVSYDALPAKAQEFLQYVMRLQQSLSACGPSPSPNGPSQYQAAESGPLRPARKRNVHELELRCAQLDSKLQRARTEVTMLACKLSKMTKQVELSERKRKKSDTEAKNEIELRKEAQRATKVAKRESTAALAKAETLKTVAANQRRAAGAARRAAMRTRQEKFKRVSVSKDGTCRPLHKVQVASRVHGGRRMALDEVHTATRGSLQVRSGCFGGLQYRLEEFVFMFKAEVYAGIASRKTLGPREEANMLCRANAAGATVHVVQPPRPGARLRRAGPEVPVQAFSRPSNSTMSTVVRPMFRMLLHYATRQLLERADTIVLMTDGKSFNSRHACGVLLSIYHMDKGHEKDAFGNCPEMRQVTRIPLQLQMQANKCADNQQTPFHVVRALELAGLGSVLRKYRHLLSITADAAIDNRGLGSFKGTMDALAGKHSLIESILVSGRAGPMVDEDLKQLGLRDVLLQFNEGNQAELIKLTNNLRQLRKAHRAFSKALCTVSRTLTTANSLQTTPACIPLSVGRIPAPTPSAAESSPANGGGVAEVVSAEGQVGENEEAVPTINEGVLGESAAAASSPSHLPASPSLPADESAGPTADTPDSGPETDGSFGHPLLASTKRDLEVANAKLDADAAAFAALHLSGSGTGICLKPDPIRLDCAGPLFRVPATVLRIYHLYENIKLTSVLDRHKLQRFWMRLWFCNAQDSRRIRLKLHLDRLQTSFDTYADVADGPDENAEVRVRQMRKLEAKKALRTFKAALQVRTFRFSSFQERGEALAGPTWQVAITQMLGDDDDANFHEFMEKLLLRPRKQPSDGRGVVSMLESASRFFPLYDQRPDPSSEISYNGHGQQCLNHAANNITNSCVRYLDHEFLNRLIQAIKCAKSIYTEDELMAAIDHLFSERPEIRKIDDETNFFRDAREAIAAQALAGQGLSLQEAKTEMGYTEEKGAETAETCAIVRWSTTTKAGDWMASHHLGYAAGFLRVGAVALDPKDEVAAVVAVFSKDGFQSEKFPNLMIEKKVSESFEFLTGSRTLIQLYLVAFLQRFIFKPLMALMSADKECGDRLGGAGGMLRRMVAVLRRGIFVGGKWSRRLAYGHRTNGAEYELSKRCICLLNPKCSKKVSLVLGDGWDGPVLSAIRKDMVEAIPLLVTRMQSLALKKDPIMPQDAERIFKGFDSMAAMFADPIRDESFALRMVQMQFLAMEVILDTATSLEYAGRHSLQAVRTYIAGMMRTLWTDAKVCCSELTPQGLVPAMRRINYAHPWALADGVITLKLCEEIMHEISEKISDISKKNPALQDQLQSKDPLDFLPAFVADTFGEEGQEGIRQWLGVSRTTGEWGAHYNRVESLVLVGSNGKSLPRIHPVIPTSCRRMVRPQKDPPELDSFEWIQALHRGFYPWWLRQNAGIFRSWWNQVAELPKPLQAFPAAYGPSRKASNMAPSSKGMEQHWASPALMFDTRSGLANHTLSHYYILPAFRDPTMDPEKLVETPSHIIDAVQEMAQLGRLAATFEVDKEKRSVMKEVAQRKLALVALKSKRGGWASTNHGGEYRRPGHAVLDPKKLKQQTKQFLTRIDGRKMGVTVTIQKAALRGRTHQPAGSASSARTATNLQRLVVRALSRSEPAQRIRMERARRIRAEEPQRPAAVPRQRCGAANSASDSDDEYNPGKVSSKTDDGPDNEAPRRSARQRHGGASCGGGGTGAVSVPSTSLSIVGARTGVFDNGDGRRVAGGIVEAEAAGGGAAGNGEGGPAPGSVGRGGGAGIGGRSGGAPREDSDEDRPLIDRQLQSKKVPDQPLAAQSLKPQTAGSSCAPSEDIDRPLRPCGKSRKVPDQPAKSLKPQTAGSSCAPREDSDDDKPLVKVLNRDQMEQVIAKEVWSIDFAAACSHLAWYENNSDQTRHVWLMTAKDTAVFNVIVGKPLEVTITRRASPYLKRLLAMKKAHGSCPAEISDDVGIKFDVRANSGRNYYMMYHDFAGVLIVKVEGLNKPDVNSVLNEDESWAKTMTFRRVFDTKDAVTKAKGQKDNGIYMGEKAMREVWRKELEKQLAPTVHEGDCTYEGDIRTLVGVARWKKEGMDDLSQDYFVEYLRSDLLVTGSSVCQNVSK
jgi:hypothetical protein